jgi:tetratricopeptide (TPR) repeat protein
MNFLSPVFALVLVLASSTAGAQAPVPAAAAKEEVKVGADLPKQDLTGQILYQFLLAEIAAQRGQFGLSAAAYLDLAKSTRDPRVVRRATEIAFHARQYDAALEAAKLWLSMEPASPQARQMHSTLLLASGRVEQLAETLAADVAADPSRVGEALMRFMRAFARYPDRLAIQRLFDRLTLPYLDLAEARFVRAQASVGVGDSVRALGEIDKALELRPDWELAALFKAELQPKGAVQLEYLQTWLAANPDSREVRLGYARALVSEKRYDAARTEFRRLLSANPDNPDILYAVGILSLQVNDTAEAEQQLKRFVEIGRGDLNPARFYLGQIAEQAKRLEDALGWYDSVAGGENLVPAKVRAAQILLRQNKLGEARERLAVARASAPGEVRLLVAEAQLLRDAGQHAEAFAFLARALESQPDQPEILYETALAAEKLGQVELLERHLRRLLELKPDSAQAYNALGYSFADRNIRLEEAAQLIDKALSLAPDDPFILDSKGWVLFRQGKAAAALDTLKKAFAQKPDAEIAAHIGEVLWTLGRPDEAKAVWRDASKAHPANETLAATIKRFLP